MQLHENVLMIHLFYKNWFRRFLYPRIMLSCCLSIHLLIRPVNEIRTRHKKTPDQIRSHPDQVKNVCVNGTHKTDPTSMWDQSASLLHPSKCVGSIWSDLIWGFCCANATRAQCGAFLCPDFHLSSIFFTGMALMTTLNYLPLKFKPHWHGNSMSTAQLLYLISD
jgi:hypothetical protein